VDEARGGPDGWIRDAGATALILTANGARHRCGHCGTVLAIAELGALKGFVIQCRRCDRYNEVQL